MWRAPRPALDPSVPPITGLWVTDDRDVNFRFRTVRIKAVVPVPEVLVVQGMQVNPSVKVTTRDAVCMCLYVAPRWLCVVACASRVPVVPLVGRCDVCDVRPCCSALRRLSWAS